MLAALAPSSWPPVRPGGTAGSEPAEPSSPRRQSSPFPRSEESPCRSPPRPRREDSELDEESGPEFPPLTLSACWACAPALVEADGVSRESSGEGVSDVEEGFADGVLVAEGIGKVAVGDWGAEVREVAGEETSGVGTFVRAVVVVPVWSGRSVRSGRRDSERVAVLVRGLDAEGPCPAGPAEEAPGLSGLSPGAAVGPRSAVT